MVYPSPAKLAAGKSSGHEEVQISVRDHGLGISEGDLAGVFEPSYRSQRSGLAKIRGTGLGLAIAKRRARPLREVGSQSLDRAPRERLKLPYLLNPSGAGWVSRAEMLWFLKLEARFWAS